MVKIGKRDQHFFYSAYETYDTYKKYGCFLRIKTITSFTVRTKPKKYGCFLGIKSTTSITVRTIPTKSTVVFYVLKQSRLLQCIRHLQKVERLFSLYLKQLLLLQCVRHLQKVRLFSTY